MMDKRTDDGLSPYLTLSRGEWAALREDTPMTLTSATRKSGTELRRSAAITPLFQHAKQMGQAGIDNVH